MKALLYLLVASCFIADFYIVVKNIGLAGKLIHVIPEVLSGIIAIMAFLAIARRGSINISARYLILVVFFILFVLAGVILNGVEVGNVLLGIRSYIRYLPIFLVPAVYAFTEQELKKLLMFVFGLSLLQLPVAVSQYLFIYIPGSGHYSGDVMRGTLNSSGILAIYLCSVISVVIAFYLRKGIGLWPMVITVIALLIPLILNDSKGTFILLIVGMGVVGWAGLKGTAGIKEIAIAMSVAVIVVTAFAVIYDRMFIKQQFADEGLVGFYFGEGLSKYLNLRLRPGRQIESHGSLTVEPEQPPGEVGRIDSTIYAYERLLNKGVPYLFFGGGLGSTNATVSGAEGELYTEAKIYGVNWHTITNIMWNLGLFGVSFLLIFLWMVWTDTRALYMENGIGGILALGWQGVVAIAVVSLVYKNVILQSAIVVPFMLFSGYIAHARLVLSREKRETFFEDALGIR